MVFSNPSSTAALAAEGGKYVRAVRRANETFSLQLLHEMMGQETMGLKSEWARDWQLVWVPSLPCWDAQVCVREGQTEAEEGPSRGWSFVPDTVNALDLLFALCSTVPAHVNNELPCLYTGFCICFTKRVHVMSKSIVNLRLLSWF